MSDLQDRIAKLELRLQDGFQKIGQAYSHGIDVKAWEIAWIELLREYETLSDELAAQKPAQATMPGMPRSEAA